MTLFGAWLRRLGGRRAFAVEVRRLLGCGQLLWDLFLWVFFSIYTFLKSLSDIIWTCRDKDNGKAGDETRLVPRGTSLGQVSGLTFVLIS